MIQSGQTGKIFVGRHQEMAELTAALDEALSGKGRLVMLAGEPGIGKTRIAQEFASLAEHRGANILWGWCHDQEGAPPYWPWLQCIRAYVESADTTQLSLDMGAGAADISEILPELTVKLEGLERPPAISPEQARFRLFFSITTFLKNLSRSQPLVLVLDDLHWADGSSLLLLEFLAREIAANPVMVVGTYRDDEVSGSHPLAQTLGNLVREPHFQRVTLGGLSRQEVGEFVQARAGVSVAETAVDTLYQRTEGNPLFVGEVVSSVNPEEMARDLTWIAAIPEAVRDAILRRLNQLSEPCRQILRTASVIGRDFELTLLRALNPEISEDEFWESLDEALGIRLVESLSDGLGRYQFGHALIQQAVYEEIPPMRRAQAHGATGETLEQLHQENLNEHAAELAHHFAEAGVALGRDKLVRYSLMAGELALASYAYEQAQVHFNRVLAAKEGLAVDADTAAALFGLFRAQHATMARHDSEESYDNLSRAFDYYASVGDMAHLVAIAEFPLSILIVAGKQTDSLAKRALEFVPEDSLEAGRLHSIHGSVQGMKDGDYQGARDSLDRALAIAKREGNAELEMRTLTSMAQVELWQNHFKESLKCSLSAMTLAVTTSNPRAEVSARYWASLSSSLLGDKQEIQRQASAILKPAEQLRDRFWLATAYETVARPLTRRGYWESAKKLNQLSLDLMPLDSRILLQRVIMEAETGNQSEVETHLERLEELMLQSDAGPNTAIAGLALVSPMARSIFGVVKRPNLGDSSIPAVLWSPSATPFFSSWARTGAALLAVMNDDNEAAEEQYAALKPLAGVVVVYANVDRILGLLSRTMRNPDQASTHFEDALAFCRKAGYQPELAWTCHDYADMLLARDGNGDSAKAVSLLAESLAISTELGMPPLMERVIALQEQAYPQPVPAPAYPDGLTQREVEVLRLVATGKTDREIAEELFISAATVSTHVRNLLNKTGVANRTEAATYAGRQRLI